MVVIDTRKRLMKAPEYCDERTRLIKISRYLGAIFIAFSASLVAFLCFKFVFICLIAFIDSVMEVIENFNSSTHIIVIQRYGDQLHVKTQINKKLQISQVSPSSQQGACIPRDTVRDFGKGTEVFVEGQNCFVRFYNHSEESYDRQMLLFEMLKDLPLQQSSDPVIYRAVQQLQFTDTLYDLLGGPVATRCDRHRLLWIFPAGPGLARYLAKCRCFDTAHARISVCLETRSEAGRTRVSWPEEVRTERPWSEPPPRGEHRRGIDRIIMRPDVMG